MMTCARKMGATLPDSLLVNPEKLSTASDRTLRHGLEAIQRELWVRHWCAKAQSYRASNRVGIMYTGLCTTVTIVPNDQVTPCVGWSQCSTTDRYDSRVGIAVATARAFGEKIPDYI